MGCSLGPSRRVGCAGGRAGVPDDPLQPHARRQQLLGRLRPLHSVSHVLLERHGVVVLVPHRQRARAARRRDSPGSARGGGAVGALGRVDRNLRRHRDRLRPRRARLSDIFPRLRQCGAAGGAARGRLARDFFAGAVVAVRVRRHRLDDGPGQSGVPAGPVGSGAVSAELGGSCAGMRGRPRFDVVVGRRHRVVRVSDRDAGPRLRLAQAVSDRGIGHGHRARPRSG